MNTWQFTPYAWLYLLAFVGAMFMTYKARTMRPARGATQFSLLTFFAGICPSCIEDLYPPHQTNTRA